MLLERLAAKFARGSSGTLHQGIVRRAPGLPRPQLQIADPVELEQMPSSMSNGIYDTVQVRSQHADAVEAWADAAKPITEAATPPASWYAEPSVAELEKRRVFWRNWQAAGHVHQLEAPGSYITGDACGMPYIVCRDSDGNALRAFHNVCRHHAAIVAHGSGTATHFECRYHGWQYGLDGRLLLAKRLKGIKGFKASENGLQPLHVDTWGPWVFIAFKPRQASLTDWLGEGGRQLLPRLAADGLRHVASREYEVQCNHKVFSDNYLDGGYHLPVAHADLTCGLDMGTYRNEVFERLSIQSVQSSPAATDRLSESEGRDRPPATYAFMYPNFMINRYGPWLDTNTVQPLSATACRVIFEYYIEPARFSDTSYINASLAASHQVQLEDIALCESVQRGLQSPVYDTGRYAPGVETPMHAFHQLLHQDLVDDS